MGQVTIITQKQRAMLDLFSRNTKLAKQFYFTGGTALSAHYLQHRYSDDLDFFSNTPIDGQYLLTVVNDWAKQFNAEVTTFVRDITYRYTFTFADKEQLLVDFSHDVFQHVRPPNTFDGITVASIEDIATNKILTVNQRTNVKDFVDLYFLLKQFTIWELIDWQAQKFRIRADIMLLSADLAKVNDFTFLPRMIVPLSLNDLKSFFRDLAKKLGQAATE